MKIGDKPKLERLAPEEHLTQPPPRYTEASLVKKLEREGIGRPSTYAAILSRIQQVGYAEKLGSGGRAPLGATPIGILVTERLEGHFPTIMELGFTRDMEAELDKIEEAHLDWRKAVAGFLHAFRQGPGSGQEGMAGRHGAGREDRDPLPHLRQPHGKAAQQVRLLLALQQGAGLQGHPAPGRARQHPEEGRAAEDGTQVRSVRRRGAQERRTLRRIPPLCQLQAARTRREEDGRLKTSKQRTSCPFTMRLDKSGHPVRKFAPLPTSLICEKCGSPLVVRVSARRPRSKGPGPRKAAKPFLSCSNFPKCRNAMDLPAELAELGKQAVSEWQRDGRQEPGRSGCVSSEPGSRAAGETRNQQPVVSTQRGFPAQPRRLRWY